jgi:hypothetical protein
MQRWLTLAALTIATLSIHQTAALADTPRTMTEQQALAGDKPLDQKGAFCGIRLPRNIIVRDTATWQKLWKEHLGGRELPLPTVDFKKHDVVAVYAGSKNTGGYAIEITEIKRGKADAEVLAVLTKPGKGSIVTQAFTSPFALRAVPKLPAKVKFTVTEKERE